MAFSDPPLTLTPARLQLPTDFELSIIKNLQTTFWGLQVSLKHSHHTLKVDKRGKMRKEKKKSQIEFRAKICQLYCISKKKMQRKEKKCTFLLEKMQRWKGEGRWVLREGYIYHLSWSQVDIYRSGKPFK